MPQDYDADLSCGESDSRFADIRAARERRRSLREGVYDEPELEREPDDRPKGALLRVLLTQAAVFALLLGGLYLTQKAAPHTFGQLQAAYARVMQTDLSTQEVWAHVRNAFSYLKDEIYVVAPPAQTQSSNDVTTEAAEPTSSPQAQGGMGGKDVAAAFAERKCSFVPLITTVPPAPPLPEGRVTSGFGLRTHPVSGLRSVHTGMDIGAAMGEPIAAAFFGRVIKAGEDEDYGKFILMEHAGGMQTFYAHCSELLAEEGMVIRAGEIIALIGSTGVSTGPHLHFEVRLDGLRRNPEPLFNGLYES